MKRGIPLLVILILAVGSLMGLRTFRPAGIAALAAGPTAKSPLQDAGETARPPSDWSSNAPPAWVPTLFRIQQDTNNLFGAAAEAQITALQNFTESIPPAEVSNALVELQRLRWPNPGNKGRDLEMRLLRRWVTYDPPAAAQWTAQMPVDAQPDAVGAVAEIWAGKDLSAASRWATGLANDGLRITAVRSVAGAVIYTDPMQALTLAANLPEDTARDQLVQSSAATWAIRAPQAAAAWAAHISDNGLQQQVEAAVAMSWADNDPASAVNYATKSLPAGEVRDDALLSIIERWGFKNAPAATEWVQHSLHGDLRQAALDTIAADAERSKSPAL